jgi:predicted nucleic acid binding AN1-type Zn finger protein
MNKEITGEKKIKCNICSKKLSIIRQKIFCKCPAKYFCAEHLLDHNCDYNHKKDYSIFQKVINTKIDKI